MNFRLYYLGYNSKKINDMKRNLIILVMLAMPFIGNAQREVGSWTFIPKVGINIAKLTDPDIYITPLLTIHGSRHLTLAFQLVCRIT